MDRATDTALPLWAFIDNRDFGQGRRVPQSTAPVIGIVRYERGFHAIRTFITADELNKAGNVTPAQREAMFAGSVFGFHVPAADPTRYDDAGNLRHATPNVHSFPMG